VEISPIALGGLERAAASFDKSATRMTAAAAPEAGDSVDLSTAAVGMLTARNQFSANLKTAHVADEMERMAIELIG
jgi:hypothetical protein